MTLSRRHLVAAAGASLALPSLGWAQAVEKPKLTIAVGGKNLLYYLPLTIAEQRGYFKAEGLDVTIVDFAGGARALQAVVGAFASFLVWMGLLRVYPATQLSSFTFLTPVFALVFGVMLLHEPLTVQLVLALVGVAVGIVLVNRKRG